MDETQNRVLVVRVAVVALGQIGAVPSGAVESANIVTRDRAEVAQAPDPGGSCAVAKSLGETCTGSPYGAFDVPAEQ